MSFLREGMVGMYFLGGPLDGQSLPETAADVPYFNTLLPSPLDPASLDVVRYHRKVYLTSRRPGLEYIFFVLNGMVDIDIDSKVESYFRHA